jgi:hypothetical protein
MLLITPYFDSWVDFKVSIQNGIGCQDHNFKQVVILTLKENEVILGAHFSISESILRFLFATLNIMIAKFCNINLKKSCCPQHHFLKWDKNNH